MWAGMGLLYAHRALSPLNSCIVPCLRFAERCACDDEAAVTNVIQEQGND